MRKTKFLIATFGWMLAAVAGAAEESRETDFRSATGGARTFDVVDYGAVGDDKTDNTAAFSKCLEALIAAGGGRMLLPDGVYRGRIVIPPVSGPCRAGSPWRSRGQASRRMSSA